MIFDLYKFDVDLARSLVSDEREVFELDQEDVDHALDWARIHKPHLEHVDIQYPGIIAHYWYPNKDGIVLHGHVLIDGHHRAAKTKELGLPFFVRVLSEEESRQVTMRAPDIASILGQGRGAGVEA
jgi:hypothetical protein